MQHLVKAYEFYTTITTCIKYHSGSVELQTGLKSVSSYAVSSSMSRTIQEILRIDKGYLCPNAPTFCLPSSVAIILPNLKV